MKESSVLCNKISLNEVMEKVSDIISPVYLVGGSVRDYILGREVNDFDFTTPMLPDDIESSFIKSGRKVWTSGKRFGTIASKVKLDDGSFEKVEVTTFRTETYEKNSRKPEVRFEVDITKDLGRRDFTMNALAYNRYKLIDPFDGQQDINSKLIRAVGNPRQRFKEDPLRIMRAARFASQLDFRIQDDTYLKMIERAHSILSISKERVMDEMNKILMSDNPSVGLDILMQTKVFNYIIPELSIQNNYDQNSSYHSYDLWTHTLRTIEYTPAELNIRWAALLHDIAKPFTRTENIKTGYSNYIKHDILGAEIVHRLAVNLKWSKEQRDKVRDIVLNHGLNSCPLKVADDRAKRP